MSLKPSSSFLKVLGLLAIFTLAPGSMYLMYYRTGGPTSNKEQVLQKNLRFAFMAGTETIDLAPLTPWPWVKVCALTSDLTEEQADAVLGFPYKDFDQLFWMHRPEFWTLVFIDSERQASWGAATPVVPVRVSRRDLAELALPDGVHGLCTDRDTGGLIISRRTDAPAGTTPVMVRIGKRAP
ncbi:MAG: hypothetical protein EPO08_17400 [Rhodospirillaceae bacterium]|nr:MAG: hypothetical protein EPO08_17400 [Rhodospirillaceae bacterium]